MRKAAILPKTKRFFLFSIVMPFGQKVKPWARAKSGKKADFSFLFLFSVNNPK